jgi:hypothetical protein
MRSNEARRLEQAWQMGFSCDIEGLPRDPRLDAYTEELLRDRSLTPAQRDRLLSRKIKELYPSWNLASELELNKADPGNLAAGKTEGVVNNERLAESELPQGRGESLVAQLDSAVNQAEQLRDEQVQQEYNDQLGVYVQEKAEQIDRLQSSLAAALTSEQAQLQAIQQRAPGWTAGKKAHAQWEQQVARRQTRIAQLARRLDRVGEIEEAAGVYAETKIEELAERKLRFDKPELAQEWDKIQRRERQALIPTIESTQSLGQDLGRSQTLSRTADEE